MLPADVFYIHGGAYRYDFVPFHWQFIEKLVRETNALVIAPAYRLAPFATYKEAFNMLDKDVSNELIVAEGMNHVYPLYPIKEAKSACNKVFHIVMR